MTRIERLLVAISLVFGLGYPLVLGLPLPPAASVAAKGAAVGLLALAAAVSARKFDGWLLAAVMALGAAGDVLLEIEFGAGAAAFAAAHVVAIVLYVRNRRAGVLWHDFGWAAVLPACSTLIPALLLRGRPESVAFSLYGLLLGAMAGSAWMSRFPRRLVADGAVLFLLSDMLIAVRLGTGASAFELGLAIWLLYYVGQLLIFLGVKSSLPAEPAGRGTLRSRVEG